MICDNSISSYRGYGIYLSSPEGEIDISRNSITGNGNNAIQIISNSGSEPYLLLTNNYLSNSSAASGSTIFLQNCTPKLYHNSIVRTGSTNAASALYFGSAISSCEIVNNIFSSTSGYAAYLGSLGSFSRFDHNLFFRSGSAAVNVNGNAVINLSQWTSATGDNSCLFTNPLLLDASYELQSGSPAINAGVVLDGVPADILGRLRILPDLGCREFDAATLGSPTNVQISYNPSGNQLILSWDPVSGASSYRIYSSADPYSFGSSYLTATGTSVSIPVSAGLRFFKVSAVN